MNRPVEERLSPPRVLSHLGVMALVSAVMGLLVAGLAIPFTGALGLGASQVAESVDNLPAELQTDDLPQRTLMVDKAGNNIATIFDQNRINIPLRQISRTMVTAILAIEDYRFYQHGALDLKGTLRALITNQASNGVVQGGSSITQQLVKLTLIQQGTKAEAAAATDDTYARKIRELRYAIALEQEHSKDWILERYLNIAYFGQGAWGIQAAAKHYFGKDAKSLNLRQSAMLAGLVKNPVGYDPSLAPDKALTRRDTVLVRMAELGAIPREEADRAMSHGLGLDIQDEPNGCLESTAQFFCDYVYAYLLEDPDLGKTRKERKDFIKSGGLTIETTIDTRFQRAAQRSVDARVDPRDAAVGGLAFVVPGTGEVRALAQSRPMGFDTKRGETFINYTIPKELGGSSGFQPGSTFKVFVLAAALTQGVPLDYTIQSPDQVAIPESEFTDCRNRPYGGSNPWDPANATTSGAKTLYSGTRESVNTFYAQLEATTGICDPFRIAKSLGIRLTHPLADKNGFGAERTPSFTLGAPDASPLEMAEAYATFAAHGLHCPAIPVTRILDSDGKVIKDYKSNCKQELDAGVADGINAVLRGVQEPGGFGYTYGLNLNIVSAGKTGTTQDQKAVWFVGYTPKLAGASMLAGANAQGEPITLQYQTVGGSYIDTASGSKVAGPMWRGAMDSIQGWIGGEDFRTPDLSGVKPRSYTTVPSVTGMSVASAMAVLHSAGLKASIDVNATGVFSTSESVVSSYPSVGSSVLSGGVVLLVPASQAPHKPPRHGGRGGPGNGNGGGGGGFGGGGGGR